jgi:hypothetical protein
MNLHFTDFNSREFFQLTPLVFRQIRETDTVNWESLVSRAVRTLKTDSSLRNMLLSYDPRFDGSWIYANLGDLTKEQNETSVLTSILPQCVSPETLTHELALVISKPSNSIPHDVLCEYAQIVIDLWDRIGSKPQEDLLELIRRSPQSPFDIEELSLKECALLHGDSIDHLYRVPRNQKDLSDWLTRFATAYRQRTASALVKRLESSLTSIKAPSPSVVDEQEVEQILRKQFQCPLQTCSDYQVNWREAVRNSKGERMLLTEISKTLCLDGHAHQACLQMRRNVINFYRAVFKISRNAVIGLTSGLFHAEHGLKSDPSYFFCGPNVIFGKGVLVDLVGGLVVGSKAFIGGGFLPVLLHTHKHTSASVNDAANERFKISRHCLFIKPGSRIKMGEKRMIEAAEYLSREEPLFSITLEG